MIAQESQVLGSDKTASETGSSNVWDTDKESAQHEPAATRAMPESFSMISGLGMAFRYVSTHTGA